MAANTGRTNAKHITVMLDNAAGTLTDISAYVDDIGSVGLEYETADVTAFSDGVTNITIGRPSAPLTLSGPWDTVMHVQAIAVNGQAAKILSLDIKIGVRQAWDTEPQFGLSQSATSGYLMHDYQVTDNGERWSAQLNVFGPTAPAWGTSAET